jgi:diguanylate cyclase (GGDEF)-like protein
MDITPKTIHILLVEDDEDDYLILRDCLMDLSGQIRFDLDWVTTYQAGLTQIQRANHDIYLIDHYLGESSGLDLLKEAIQAGCQEPIIVITGQSAPEIDHAALQAGATDYLEKKQITGQLLERSIRYAMERNRLIKKIRELAVRDALTGLYNRRELHRFLDYELIKSKRYSHPFSILLMDIDHFKEINDRFGHRNGDEILQQVANVLLHHTRGCDLCARYGGDEFIIVMPETPAGQAWYGAERLRKVVERHSIQISAEPQVNENLSITISTGIAEFPADDETGQQLIDLADKALYQAKHQGCNQAICYHLSQSMSGLSSQLRG